MYETVDMSVEEMENLKLESAHQYYASDFNFLNEHKGWRPKAVHLFMAPTHHGKSTLTRSLCWDFLVNNQSMLDKASLWLSEESKEDFKKEFAKIGMDRQSNIRLAIESELDLSGFSLPQKKIAFKEFVYDTNPRILLFDNVTTSSFYMDRGNEEQGSFATYLKTIANDLDIPIGIIAHTGGESQMLKRLLELNDIRGGKSLVNLAQFAYILQTFKVYDEVNRKVYKFPTIRMEKHRGYDCENILFQMIFNKETMSFMEDEVKNWNEFKELFGRQMSL